MQQVTRDTGFAFTGIKKILRETFLPRLFFGNTPPLPLAVGTLITMLVRKSGLGLQNTVASAHKKIESSQRVSVKLINAVTGEIDFSVTEHLRSVSEE